MEGMRDEFIKSRYTIIEESINRLMWISQVAGEARRWYSKDKVVY
jgi:hypothetical protein